MRGMGTGICVTTSAPDIIFTLAGRSWYDLHDTWQDPSLKGLNSCNAPISVKPLGTGLELRRGRGHSRRELTLSKTVNGQMPYTRANISSQM